MDGKSVRLRRAMNKILTPRQIRDGFSVRMAKLRLALDYRFVPEFAKDVELSKESIYKYEGGGARLPRLDGPVFQKIRIGTGATVDWLLYGTADSLPTELRKKLSAYERSHPEDGDG